MRSGRGEGLAEAAEPPSRPRICATPIITIVIHIDVCGVSTIRADTTANHAFDVDSLEAGSGLAGLRGDW